VKGAIRRAARVVLAVTCFASMWLALSALVSFGWSHHV